MELPIHKFQTIKLGIHIAQLVSIFVAWVLCITVFKSSADVDGRFGWYFGLCFLSTIPLIYLTLTPRFPRTRKFANPYATAVVDLLFALLWLTAFAAVANWNGDDKKCGSGCGRSKAVVGLGVFIWLLFTITTAMSIYSLLYYRREGYLPGASRIPNNAAMIDPDKEAFSTAPGIDEYAPVHNSDAHDEPVHGDAQYESNHYGGLGNSGYKQPRVEETEYTGYGGFGGGQSAAGERAHFPGGNYNA